MKKIIFLASVLVMMASCNKKPGGNHDVLPVVHPPVEAPSHDDHGAHGAHDNHAKDEHATEEHATEKADSTHAQGHDAEPKKDSTAHK